jgi:hypothetical protein
MYKKKLMEMRHLDSEILQDIRHLR